MINKKRDNHNIDSNLDCPWSTEGYTSCQGKHTRAAIDIGLIIHDERAKMSTFVGSFDVVAEYGAWCVLVFIFVMCNTELIGLLCGIYIHTVVLM